MYTKLNEQELQLWNQCVTKFNAEPAGADLRLRLYGGMFYSILANKHWHTPAITREDKIRDMMKCNIPEQMAVVEYVVRHDYPQLINILEE